MWARKRTAYRMQISNTHWHCSGCVAVILCAKIHQKYLSSSWEHDALALQHKLSTNKIIIIIIVYVYLDKWCDMIRMQLNGSLSRHGENKKKKKKPSNWATFQQRYTRLRHKMYKITFPLFPKHTQFHTFQRHISHIYVREHKTLHSFWHWNAALKVIKCVSNRSENYPKVVAKTFFKQTNKQTKTKRTTK